MPSRISKICIIAGDCDDIEELCKFYREEDTYLPLFESPDNHSEKYGFLKNRLVKIGNLIKFSEPKYLILYKCSQKVMEGIKGSFSDTRIEIVQATELSDSKLDKIPKTRKKIEIEEFKVNIHEKVNVVFVENKNPVVKSIANNLTVFVKGKLLVSPPSKKEDREKTMALLRDWSKNDSSPLEKDSARGQLLDFLNSRIPFNALKNALTVTFITDGLPYGLLPFNCPTTHNFCFAGILGLDIIKGILKGSSPRLRCPLAILCDPNVVGGTEFKDLRSILGKEYGYTLRNAYDKNAQAYIVHMLVENHPCDIILFTSHGGEQKGEIVTEIFDTADGKTHEIKYARVVAFAPTQEKDMIYVNDFKSFISMDGIVLPFDTEECNKAFDYYVELIQSKDYRPKNTQIENANYEIENSDSIQMADSIFPFALNDCGGQSYPLVFCNICNSWKKLSERFSAAGSSVFVGTATVISNYIAPDVAVAFFQNLMKGKTVSFSLFRAQKGFIRDLGYTPYLLNGYIFSTMLPCQPYSENILKVLRYARDTLSQWEKYTRSLESDGDVKKVQRVKEFLEDELKTLESVLNGNQRQ